MTEGICRTGTRIGKFHHAAYIPGQRQNYDNVWCLYCNIPLRQVDGIWGERTKYPPEKAPEGEE